MSILGISERNGPWYLIEHSVFGENEYAGVIGRSEWADWSREGDLLFTQSGCLFRLRPSKGGFGPIEESEQIADFNNLEFQRVEPPAGAHMWPTKPREKRAWHRLRPTPSRSPPNSSSCKLVSLATVPLPRRKQISSFTASRFLPRANREPPNERDTMTASAPSPDHILQTGLAFWASKTLLSAVEMEVFTELAKGPESLESLTGRLGLHPRSSRDFLDALVALGFLERQNGHYANTPSSNVFLDKRKPSYIGGMLEMANKRLFHHWGHLTTALRTGENQNEATGDQETFGALYADPTRLKGFLRAMTGVSRGANMAIAAKFPWANYKTVADCGTAQGDLDRAGSAQESASRRAPDSTCPKSHPSSRNTSKKTVFLRA